MKKDYSNKLKPKKITDDLHIIINQIEYNNPIKILKLIL